MTTIYDFTALTNRGVEKSFADYRGQVLLIVNTASKCGFTPQYKELEALYQKYKDAGLVVIGFPCDQFAHQEPGTDTEIEQFCQINFGVTFPLMKKIEVNGENEHPLYTFLKAQAGGYFARKIKWNFTKFLVSRNGSVIKRYAPATKPMKIEKDIVEMLKAAEPL
jgi:glutathione peroxidase